MDRLISAERLKAHYSWWGDDPMRETFDLIVDLQPTVDPVVRCMDCKHSEHWYGDRDRCFLWVEDGIGVFEDGFCSYGERKGGNDD